jgi:hypothetical protein
MAGISTSTVLSLDATKRELFLLIESSRTFDDLHWWLKHRCVTSFGGPKTKFVEIIWEGADSISKLL